SRYRAARGRIPRVDVGQVGRKSQLHRVAADGACGFRAAFVDLQNGTLDCERAARVAAVERAVERAAVELAVERAVGIDAQIGPRSEADVEVAADVAGQAGVDARGVECP